MIEKIRNRFEQTFEERGVSPVIGVILMVAITVILAAAIGTFLLGFGDDFLREDQPQASVRITTTTSSSGNTHVELTAVSMANANKIEVNYKGNTATLNNVGGVHNTSTKVSGGLTNGDTVTVVAIKGDSERTIRTYQVE